MSPMRNLLILVVLASLAGCEGEEAKQASADTAAPSRPRQADPTAEMVTAVSGATERAPVELKFHLADRPELGKPFDVEIAVVPVGDIDRVAASFHVGPGLELRNGEQMAAIQNPEPNTPINHKITLVPQQDGIFFVSATVHVDAPTESLTRTFTFPIIAGAGVAPVEGGSAAPEKK
jgi:hypothetical protein